MNIYWTHTRIISYIQAFGHIKVINKLEFQIWPVVQWGPEKQTFLGNAELPFLWFYSLFRHFNYCLHIISKSDHRHFIPEKRLYIGFIKCLFMFFRKSFIVFFLLMSVFELGFCCHASSQRSCWCFQVWLWQSSTKRQFSCLSNILWYLKPSIFNDALRNILRWTL